MAGEHRNIHTNGGNYNEYIGGDYVEVNPFINDNTRLKERNRQALLNKVNNFWIEGVLKRSLYSQILIELDLEERKDIVAQPWNIALQTPENESKSLPKGTRIIDIFEQIDEGESLLILGEPGAGKTTTLLNLTRELIARVKKNDEDLIPVIFNLSSWSINKRKFADWLIEELNSQYKVPKRVGRAFIKHNRLLLLLDGLDEVKAEYREYCVDALNQFRQEHCPKIVVCSRIQDYEALDKGLQFQKVVCLKLLTLNQIRDYFNSLNFNTAGLKTLIEQDITLQELAKFPLMLNLIILAYRGVAVEDMPQAKIIAEWQTQLFDDYIERMLDYDRTFGYQASSKNEREYLKKQTKSWLIWLAKKMSQESKTVFLIERMQPNWLNSYLHENFYLLIYISIEAALHILLILMGTWALFSMDNIDLMKFAPKVMTWGLGFLFLLLYFARTKHFSSDNINENFKIDPVENLRFSVKNFLKTWKKEFKLIKQLVPLSIIIVSIVVYIVTKSLILIVLATFFMLTFLVLSIFVNGLVESEEVKQKIIPNQGIRKSIVNLLFLTIIIYPYFQIMTLLNQYIILKVILHKTLNNPELISCSIISSLFFSISAATLICGKPVIQHFSLRLILWINGFIPWNYAHFLDYATHRTFLQKVGGGYIFIHRMLLEHFAQMELQNLNLSERIKSSFKYF
ncbi:MAG: NACHT domain-containing protein [Cyanobacteria bacterium P01_G01_bin.39]